LKGDMSVVGPRPEIPQYINHYTGKYECILSLRPGMTDPATLMFMNEGELLKQQKDPLKFYEEYILPKKLELYLMYYRKRSLLYDLKILFLTVWRVLFGKRRR